MNIFRFFSPVGPRLALDVEGERYILSAAAPVRGYIQMAFSSRTRCRYSRSAFPRPPIPLRERESRFSTAGCTGSLGLRRYVFALESGAYGRKRRRRRFLRPSLRSRAPRTVFQGHAAPRRGAETVRFAFAAIQRGMCPNPNCFGFVVSRAIVGYTIGNDVSSRSIEGENPLYLPQAKVFDGACALGPVIALSNGDEAPRNRMTMRAGA